MSFTVVIPARLASTRLPGKVLRDIAGRPMVAHVCARALESGASRVVVATDDAGIARAAEAAGAQPATTGPHHDCGSDRIAQVASDQSWDDDEIVVNVQADEPLMPPALIDQVAAALAKVSNADMATACTPIHAREAFHDPNIVKVVADATGRALYFSRAPIPYHRGNGNAEPGAGVFRHLGIYAYRVGALKRFSAAPASALERCESLEQLRAFDLGMTIQLVQAAEVPGPGVDTEADLVNVTRLLTYYGSRNL